ncbi:hypothetical protein SCATT_34640 [Streptantibioticus cattleyicolor NRRL 8057 = DSM 46488]|uniref:Uncharacterized protein n=1 Tax=Streptantibioticus cattleyicolor (strain ATCC 35852 / DSM 46488 / JCM 4925 / NBRC 14057 / NRRL 8057) TaxID=1003195 RepID=F8JXF5_STREN|nr:hypothetical protein SCATT_34640 [Streptantibioticus cattleyicolor NRRL 8057 = DSM 46488]MYS60378.1 hypothetical protein [Streptomyces sp. SID5468]CCB76174.1 protein of unknown function [Streptantibioticus cattleyicolor NRRL 8057 = DSM 46488]
MAPLRPSVCAWTPEDAAEDPEVPEDAGADEDPGAEEPDDPGTDAPEDAVVPVEHAVSASPAATIAAAATERRALRVRMMPLLRTVATVAHCPLPSTVRHDHALVIPRYGAVAEPGRLRDIRRYAYPYRTPVRGVIRPPGRSTPRGCGRGGVRPSGPPCSGR